MMGNQINQQLNLAVHQAIKGNWDEAHKIAQEYNTPIACWIHAVLHKIEPDEWNSRYWYSRSAGHYYEEFADPIDELQKIATLLDKKI